MTHFSVLVIGTDVDRQMAPYDENIEVEPYTNDDGEETTYNPKSKWDYYGSGWEGFVTKNGRSTSEARYGEIDWNASVDALKRKREDDYDRAMTQEPEAFRGFVYDIRPGETKEQYVGRKTRWRTTAVVKGGVWYEEGEVGWFGSISNQKDDQAWEEEFRSLLRDLPPDTPMTILDCHI